MTGRLMTDPGTTTHHNMEHSKLTQARQHLKEENQ